MSANRHDSTPAGGVTGTDPLADLVSRFSAALLAKLRYARDVKGRSGWNESDWMEECQRGLIKHVAKGDPLDVAAYTAFCWHHEWLTSPSDAVAAEPETEPTRAMIDAAVEFHANGHWDVSDESIFGGIYKAMRAAAPPVRDREAIRKAAKRGYMKWLKSKNNVDAEMLFGEIADAILSLPSAPVSETLLHSFRKNPHSTADQCALCGNPESDHAAPVSGRDAVIEEWQDIASAPKDQEVEVRGIWKLRGDGIVFTHWRSLSNHKGTAD